MKEGVDEPEVKEEVGISSVVQGGVEKVELEGSVRVV